MPPAILLGDEAVALGAVHAGIHAAYGYPGTPSTEILEFLLSHRERHGMPHAAWCANEKTAYEAALGVAFAGRRALVTMKHVGLNVALDAFVNSALVGMHGGLVVAVADDPGMHSSQNEQDSRELAAFARVPCFEPATQQEAYEMTREAFDMSERFHVPVLLRLVTRLAHSRTQVETTDPVPEAPVTPAPDRNSWILLPGNARRQWKGLVERQPALRDFSQIAGWNEVKFQDCDRAVITTGIARNYLAEVMPELGFEPSHLHLGLYPLPEPMLRRLAAHARRILVLEDGYPYVESRLRGILPSGVEVRGRLTGHVPATGELDPDVVRAAFGLPPRETVAAPALALPARPPQLCQGCPHDFAFRALEKALQGFEGARVTADIGCSTLGALPPHSVIESCVCMGASIGMARGAAEAGIRPVVAVIGDSTFLHSGMTSTLEVVAADTDMTLLILDNMTVAMTGTQPTLVTSERLDAIVRGLGVNPDHLHVIDPHPRRVAANAEVMRHAMEHRGLSVIIARRACKQIAAEVESPAGAGASHSGDRPSAGAAR